VSKWKRGCLGSLIVGPVLLYVLFTQILYPSRVVRYQLTVDLVTNDGQHHVGSGVWQVEYYIVSDLSATGGGGGNLRTIVSADAIPIHLSKDEVVFVMLGDQGDKGLIEKPASRLNDLHSTPTSLLAHCFDMNRAHYYKYVFSLPSAGSICAPEFKFLPYMYLAKNTQNGYNFHYLNFDSEGLERKYNISIASASVKITNSDFTDQTELLKKIGYSAQDIQTLSQEGHFIFRENWEDKYGNALPYLDTMFIRNRRGGW